MMKMILVAHLTAEGSWAIRRGREAIERGNRRLRSLFVQAAWVVLVKIGPRHWDRYGLQSWIEAAKKRLHHNVALANKLARIAWAVLHEGRAFECVKTNEAAYRPA
jgi:transposase